MPALLSDPFSRCNIDSGPKQDYEASRRIEYFALVRMCKESGIQESMEENGGRILGAAGHLTWRR